MAQRTDDGPAKAVAEDLTVLTPEEVPATVECAISRRNIPGTDAREVIYMKGKARWVHKRFIGEADGPDEDDDDLVFDEELDDYDLDYEEDFASEAPDEPDADEETIPAVPEH